MSIAIRPPEPVKTPAHTKPIVVQNTRILTPSEYAWLRRYLPTELHREFLDGLLVTGMRATEWEAFVRDDFDWYDQPRRSIVVPEYAVKKVKVKVKRRNIMLSDAGILAIDKLIRRQDAIPKNAPLLHMPLRASWGVTLRRAAYKGRIPDPDTIVPKSTRKTWESWLILTHPNNSLQITMSMGHDDRTAMRHYLGLGWSVQELIEAKEYTRGFIQEIPDIVRARGNL